MPTQKKARKTDPLAGLPNLLLSLHIEDGNIAPQSRVQLNAFIGKLLKEDPWRQHLGPLDLSSIFHRHISAAISDDEEELSHTSGKLRQLLTAGDMDDVAAAIKKYLKSIPRSYVLWIKLPSMPRWETGEIQLSKRLSLVEINNEDLPSGAQVTDETGEKPLIGKPAVFLKIACSGYGSWRTGTSALASGLSAVKQFLQLCAPAKVIYRDTWLWLFETIDAGKVTAFLQDAKTGGTMNAPLSANLSEALSSITVDTKKLLKTVLGDTILTSIQVAAVSRDEKVKALRDAVTKEAKLLDLFATEPTTTRIATALEWAFDCAITDDETLAFLQATIGLEALLGDEARRDSVTERLADRCAYLLGHTETERQRVRDNFKEVYDARSKIVHGRKSRLGQDDAKHLSTAKRLLSDAAWQEIRNLHGDIAPREGF